MSTLLFILWFCLLVCSVGYLVCSYVLTRDIRRLSSSPYSNFQKGDLKVARRRDLKFSGMLFMTALFTCFISFFIQAGWEPGSFGIFLVISDIAIILTAVVDIIENATYLHKYIPLRLMGILTYVALVSWVIALFFFFYWLPWVAVVTTIVICIVLLIIYIRSRNKKNCNEHSKE